MQSVVVGWQVYAITHDALSLGMIGLSEAIPFLLIALFAGHIADKVNRKRIILVTNIIYLICAVGLFIVSSSVPFLLQSYGAYPIFGIILITGLARGFLWPAQAAYGAQIVPRELFGNALTWNSVTWQVAAVTGPAIGGLICGFYGIPVSYILVTVLSLLGLLCFSVVTNKPMPEAAKKENIWESLSAGLKFVFSNQIILSAVSLDMFAVFFGGAVSILPIFADQVLHTDARGLGFLRAAPAVGAIVMSVIQTRWPVFKKAGTYLLWCVAGFGVTIILFALSTNIYLALTVLVMNGMFDNVSVIVRGTIIQLYTPDEMRGRVSSVNSIFIGSSNELGSFESGLAAKLLGLVPSIIFGGSMTLAVVASVRKLAPKLKSLQL
jgi:MFS family permease